jgi:hypothetical protein
MIFFMIKIVFILIQKGAQIKQKSPIGGCGGTAQYLSLTNRPVFAIIHMAPNVATEVL